MAHTNSPVIYFANQVYSLLTSFKFPILYDMSKLKWPPQCCVLFYSPVLLYAKSTLQLINLSFRLISVGWNWLKVVSTKNPGKSEWKQLRENKLYIFFVCVCALMVESLLVLSFCFSVWDIMVVSGWWFPLNCRI